MKRTIRLRESELIDMIDRIIKEQQDYTFSPSDDIQTDKRPSFMTSECDEVIELLNNVAKQLNEIKDKKEKDRIMQASISSMLSGNKGVKTSQLTNQIFNSDIIRNYTKKKPSYGSINLIRIVADCGKTRKSSMNPELVKLSNEYKIKIGEMPHGGAGDDCKGGMGLHGTPSCPKIISGRGFGGK